MEALAADAEKRTAEHNTRAAALDACIEKLREPARHLVRPSHTEGETAESVGKQVNRSVHAIYKAIKRIRKVLFDCTDRALASEASA